MLRLERWSNLCLQVVDACNASPLRENNVQRAMRNCTGFDGVRSATKMPQRARAAAARGAASRFPPRRSAMPALPPKETIAADSPDNPFGGGVWPLALAWCAETAGGEFPDTMAVVDVGERCGRASARRIGDGGQRGCL